MRIIEDRPREGASVSRRGFLHRSALGVAAAVAVTPAGCSLTHRKPGRTTPRA